MTVTRAVLSLAALLSAAPLTSAFATAEYSERLALEVAVKRAQVRAAYCRQREAGPSGMVAVERLRLPSWPATGTAGPVPVPLCPDSRR